MMHDDGESKRSSRRGLGTVAFLASAQVSEVYGLIPSWRSKIGILVLIFPALIRRSSTAFLPQYLVPGII